MAPLGIIALTSVLASPGDGFSVVSADDRFALRLGFLGQVAYGLRASPAETSQEFSVRRARPILQADLWDGRVKALLMPEFATATPSLLDATATISINPAFGIQVGQFRPWVSRGNRTGLTVQALPDRGPVVSAFRLERDIGVTFLGRPASGRFEYYLGVANGDGPSPRDIDSRLLYTARLVVAPLGAVAYDQVPYVRDPNHPFRVALGAAAYTVERIEQPEVASARPEGGVASSPSRRRDLGASGDVVLAAGRLSTQMEGFWRRRLYDDVRVEDAWGAYGQIAALLVPNRFGAAMRVGVSTDVDGVSMPIEPGLNIYIAEHHAKFQLRYTCTLGDKPVCDRHDALAQAQLFF